VPAALWHGGSHVSLEELHLGCFPFWRRDRDWRHLSSWTGLKNCGSGSRAAVAVFPCCEAGLEAGMVAKEDCAVASSGVVRAGRQRSGRDSFQSGTLAGLTS
jgi:hypothetical protein